MKQRKPTDKDIRRALVKKIEETERKLRRAMRALRRYGRHDNGAFCYSWGAGRKCICGFDAARRRLGMKVRGPT